MRGEQRRAVGVWQALLASVQVIGGDDVTFEMPQYDANLDSAIFRGRLDRARDMQRLYLRATAELGPEPQKAADVAALMGCKSQQVATTRAELINMGLLHTPDYVYAAFTVAQFDQSIRRIMPELKVPSRR
jgi:hypothetical protein